MIQEIDFAILDWIQANMKCGFLDFIMPKITVIGEHGIGVIVIGVVMLIFRSQRKSGLVALTGMGIGALTVNVFLKNVVARQRPCWINPDVVLLAPVPKDYSFPSGHTLHIFILATVLMYYNKKLGIPALILAVLMAFSRLYLYMHFPTDVLAAIVIGVGIGLLTILFYEKTGIYEKACDKLSRKMNKNSAEE